MSDGDAAYPAPPLICFDAGENARYQVRAAGVAVRPSDGAALLHKVTGRDHYWSLPGGRSDLHEPSDVTVARELREEIGVAETRVERLLLVAETFFSYQGVRYHELGFYYLVSFPADPWVYDHAAPFDGTEGSLHLTYAWLRPDDPAVAPRLFPTFLPALLTDLPDAPRHLVFHERDGVPDAAPIQIGQAGKNAVF
ncbi:MAG TPA: NUDIX domain-containing protein [Armatimonadaceae bacterium]|nr:NUDIX domain-containing protein [Armatimonadaceae bacterium]